MKIALLGAWNKNIDLFIEIFFTVSIEEQSQVIAQISPSIKK